MGVAPGGNLQENVDQHLIIIALDDVRASYMLNRSWQHVDYTKGDIGIFPASQPFPRTEVDREVPLIDLLLNPQRLPVRLVNL